MPWDENMHDIWGNQGASINITNWEMRRMEKLKSEA